MTADNRLHALQYLRIVSQAIMELLDARMLARTV